MLIYWNHIPFSVTSEALPRIGRAILAWIVLVSPLVSPAEELPELVRQQRKLFEIEQEAATLRREVAVRRAERDHLLGELEQSERDVAALARAGHQLDREMRAQRQTVARLKSELAAEDAKLAREQQALGELMRAVYAAGPADRLRLLLDQDGAERVSRLLAYYDYINRQRLARIAQARTAAERLRALATAAADEAERLRRLAERQRKTRERLEAAQQRRAGLLAEAERGIATGAERIAILDANAQGLRDLIVDLKQRGQIMAEVDVERVGLPERRGRLPWPAAGRLAACFGSPKVAGRMTWDGVVIAAPEGTEVYAVHAGQVVYANWLRGFGLLVILDHGDGYMSLYGNNQAILKDKGEWAMAGEAIALSGPTGGRSIAGLYFALRHGSQALDPEDWCSDRIALDGPAP